MKKVKLTKDQLNYLIKLVSKDINNQCGLLIDLHNLNSDDNSYEKEELQLGKMKNLKSIITHQLN
jgi:hypothetical protein